MTLTPGNDYHSLHMTGLFADGWFYISSAGLLVSGVLFFFLLGQYRAASEAADTADGAETEAESPAHEPVAPVMVRDEKPAEAPARVSSVEKPKAEEVQTPAYAGPDRRKDPANTTGGLPPAVVYLQNIKLELDEIHKEMRALAKRVDDELGGVASRDEALIERLADLTRSVEALKTAAPVAAAPAPVEAPKPEPKPEPKPKAEKPAPKPKAEPKPPLELSMPEPVPAPKTEPVVEAAPAPEPVKPAVSPDETIRMELGNLISPTPAPAPAAADAPTAEPAPEEKPRRGPVWPV